MSNETRHPITKKAVVYQISGMDAVTIRRDIPYGAPDHGDLTMDIYYPSDMKGGDRPPAVIFVTGYPGPGFQKMLGCKIKDMESYISWARLSAVSGLVAITYSNTEPVADAHAVIRYIQENAATLGID